jgi:hypothetical protein
MALLEMAGTGGSRGLTKSNPATNASGLPNIGSFRESASSVHETPERMHRTLKEDTTNPVALTLRLQQRKFGRFRQMFNHERPHEGLNNLTPGSLYQPSSVMFPRTLIEYIYPKGFLTRRVNNSGDISWHKDRVFISEVFRFEDLGFELVAEDFYKVFFRDIEIGEFDVEALRFRPVYVSR